MPTHKKSPDLIQLSEARAMFNDAEDFSENDIVKLNSLMRAMCLKLFGKVTYHGYLHISHCIYRTLAKEYMEGLDSEILKSCRR